MSGTVRVIIVNSDEEATPELRANLLNVPGVKIVAEIDEPACLAQTLEQFPAEVLLLHLDPNPAAMMELVAPLIETYKDRLAAIAMTEDRDAELVMRAMRVGMREFLWKPFPPEQLSDILKRLVQDVPTGTRRCGRLIPIVGVCGGVGATTLATNLASELAQLEPTGAASNGAAGRGINGSPAARAKVALVDLDFRFGQVAMFLDAQPKYTIAELCETPGQIDQQMIERAMVKLPSGLHILSHPADFEKAERISAAACAGAMAALQENYDFVVVDGPVRFDPTARAVFDMTDVYLVVMQLLVPAVRNTDRLLHELARNGFNLDRIRLVCNRAGREAGHLEPADAETTLNRKLDWIIPDDWKTSSTAVNMGAPLLDYAPKSKLRLAYRQIAQALVSLHDPPPEAASSEAAPAAGKKGLFSFFAGQKA